jgi:uncharacterized membrane protein YdfJ with MMPL/SSD domain
LFLSVVLFGLSMGYHVFILSGVREAVDRDAPTEAAVRRSIALTAGVVTAAAVVMVCVFALFGMLSSLELKQAGVGLAAAVLIDATVIRALLLPATMKLLGDPRTGTCRGGWSGCRASSPRGGRRLQRRRRLRSRLSPHGSRPWITVAGPNDMRRPFKVVSECQGLGFIRPR